MAWIVRIILFIVAPIAGLFVARDALNFGLFQSSCKKQSRDNKH